jgi:hypothetical protein
MDRRIVFFLIAIAVIFPLVKPFGLKITTSKPVENVYKFVDKLPKGSVIWVGFDYYNSTTTECSPIATAFLRQAFSKGHKVFVTSTIPDGNKISLDIVNDVAKEYNKEYGKDYVILGYKPGSMILIKQVCDNIRSLYPTDIYGTNIDDLPMMAKINDAKSINMVFTSTDNASFDEYVKVASTQYHIPAAGGSTGVSVPMLYTFLNSGQILGLVGGLKGAAEYETLINHPDTATAGMDAQSCVHLTIVCLILFSNFAYFLNKFNNTPEDKPQH